MSKRPPRALRMDPANPRQIRYYGAYILWWDDGNWEGIKCVNCGAELTTPESQERGCGPTCALVVTEAAKEAVLRQDRRNAEEYLDEKRHPRRRWSATRGNKTDRRAADPTRPPSGTARRSKPKGITNELAKELAQLQKSAGEQYSGRGMTAHQALAEIRRLKRELGR